MEKQFILTDRQRQELISVLLEMQAKFSFNAIQMLSSLPEAKEKGGKND